MRCRTPPRTAAALAALIRFYESGEESNRIAYDIAWLRDQESTVDTINGFIEVYLDPRGVKGAWEAVVCYVNPEKTRRITLLASNAQWFEDHMPWDPRFRKSEVTGVTARAIEVVIETGDSGPITPIGINLPNDQAIRDDATASRSRWPTWPKRLNVPRPKACASEFCWDDAEAARAKRWGAIAQELTTDMHEVIGHGSGRMAEHVTVPPHRLLAEQYRQSRKRVPTWSPSTSCLTSSWSNLDWSLPRTTTILCGPSSSTRERRSCDPPRSRRRAARGRPHAESAADRAAARAHYGDRCQAP